MKYLRSHADVVVLAAAALLASLTCGAQPLPNLSNPDSARAYVRIVIKNQLRSDQDKSHYMYRLQTRTKNGVQTRENIETDVLTLSRLVAINGQPLNMQQKVAEDARLQELLNDTDEQQKKVRKDKEDQQHTQRLLQSMPDAFIYTYEGTEPGPNGSELIRLSFRPDPNFNPPSHEAQVFVGMQGKMWIDPASAHLRKIEATLFRNVNFGWGILGHLDKGGRFIIEQERLPTGRWEQTHEILDFTGKALFFHTISIHDNETESDFRRVPDHLSLKDGLEMLNQQAAVLAQNASGLRGER